MAKRVCFSLLAITAGWAVGLVYFIGVTWATSAHWLSDLPFIAAWTAISALAGWCLFFLPLVIFVPPTSAVYRRTVFPVVGAVLGMVSFGVLIAWWAPLWESWVYAVYPAVVGAGAAVTFTWLEQRPGQQVTR